MGSVDFASCRRMRRRGKQREDKEEEGEEEGEEEEDVPHPAAAAGEDGDLHWAFRGLWRVSFRDRMLPELILVLRPGI